MSSVLIDDERPRQPLGATFTATTTRSNQDDELEILPEKEVPEEEGNTCIICQSVWASEGDHRVVACKCGHMFGKSCIMKWVQQQHSCPVCKVKLNTTDIFPLYFESTTSALQKMEMRKQVEKEANTLRKQLRQERKKRKKAENCVHSVGQMLHTKIAEIMQSSSISKAHSNDEIIVEDQVDESVPLSYLRELENHIQAFEIPQFNTMKLKQKRTLASAGVEVIQSERKKMRKVNGGSSSVEKLDSEIDITGFVENQSISLNGGCKLFEFMEPGRIIIDQPRGLATRNLIDDSFDRIELNTVRSQDRSGSIISLLYDQQRKLTYCTSSTRELLVVSTTDKKATTSILLPSMPTALAHIPNTNYVAVGSEHGAVLLYDLRQNDLVATLNLSLDSEKIYSLSYARHAQGRGFLVAKGRQNGRTYYCNTADNINYQIQELSLPNRTQTPICFHVEQDLGTGLCVSSSMTSATSPERSISHTIYRLDQMITYNPNSPSVPYHLFNQASRHLPRQFQPSYFQQLGVEDAPDIIPSPTHLFSIPHISEKEQEAYLLDDDDDDVLIVDSKSVQRRSLLAFTENNKVSLIDAKTCSHFQDLPNKHRYPLNCIKSLNHSLGCYLGQLSRDQFTLFRL